MGSLLLSGLSSTCIMADPVCLRMGRNVSIHRQHSQLAYRPQTAARQLVWQHRRGRCVRSSPSESLAPQEAAQPASTPSTDPQQPQQPQQPQPATETPQQQAPPAPAVPRQQPAPQQPAIAKPKRRRTVVTPEPPIAVPQQAKKQPAQQQAAHKHHKQQQHAGHALQQAKDTLQQGLTWLRGVLAHTKVVPASLAAFLVGGWFICSLLWGWARGSPIRKHNPYTFTVIFAEASKICSGTPVRMKGVQIGQINKVTLQAGHLEAVAEVCDSSNIIPVGSRVDVNLLGLAADPWIDITSPPGCIVPKDRGPHNANCAKDGLIVCNGGVVKGHQGGSSDYMTKFFLSQHDRTRLKTVDVIYHSRPPPPQQQQQQSQEA